MSLRTYANKRDASEAGIVEILRKAGCAVIRLDKPVDLLIGYRGRTYLAECKTGKGKHTADQQKFMTEWRGAPVATVRSIDEAEALLKQWGTL